MIQEDKDLLLKDLCARLPYGVIVETQLVNAPRAKYPVLKVLKSYMLCDFMQSIENVILKPYLRPMSSMTEEERLELSMLTNDGFKFYLYTNEPIIMCSGKDYNYLNGLSILDWLNEHHFDFRNLIERGLAIEVTEENNPY